MAHNYDFFKKPDWLPFIHSAKWNEHTCSNCGFTTQGTGEKGADKFRWSWPDPTQMPYGWGSYTHEGYSIFKCPNCEWNKDFYETIIHKSIQTKEILCLVGQSRN